MPPGGVRARLGGSEDRIEDAVEAPAPGRQERAARMDGVASRGVLSSTLRGHGVPVVMLASLGRPASDFDELVAAIDEGGFRAVEVELHGIGASGAAPSGATLHDLAADVAATIGQISTEPVHLVGHAFGNRLARCVSADRPEIIRSLTVLGCGGKVAPTPDVLAALVACFDEDLEADAHRAAVTRGFFAPGNEPPPAWLQGWHAAAALAQREALAQTDTDDWWLPPEPVPVLAVVGRQDVIAPPANARSLVGSLGERAKLVEIDGAGHALLPERPGEVASAILRHISTH